MSAPADLVNELHAAHAEAAPGVRYQCFTLIAGGFEQHTEYVDADCATVRGDSAPAHAAHMGRDQ